MYPAWKTVCHVPLVVQVLRKLRLSMANRSLSANHSQLKELVLKAVGDCPEEQLNTLRTSVFTLAAEQDLLLKERPINAAMGMPFSFSQDSLCDVDFGRVVDIVWELVIEGILCPGQRQPSSMSHESFNLPFFHLTEKGRHLLGIEHK
jgi:hypothetical protein